MLYAGQKDAPRKWNTAEDSVAIHAKHWGSQDPTTQAHLRASHENCTKAPPRDNTSQIETTADSGRTARLTRLYSSVQGHYTGEMSHSFICMLPTTTDGHKKSKDLKAVVNSLRSYPESIAYLQGENNFVAIVGFGYDVKDPVESNFKNHLSGLYPVHLQIDDEPTLAGIIEWIWANPRQRR